MHGVFQIMGLQVVTVEFNITPKRRFVRGISIEYKI